MKSTNRDNAIEWAWAIVGYFLMGLVVLASMFTNN